MCLLLVSSKQCGSPVDRISELVLHGRSGMINYHQLATIFFQGLGASKLCRAKETAATCRILQDSGAEEAQVLSFPPPFDRNVEVLKMVTKPLPFLGTSSHFQKHLPNDTFLEVANRQISPTCWEVSSLANLLKRVALGISNCWNPQSCDFPFGPLKRKRHILKETGNLALRTRSSPSLAAMHLEPKALDTDCAKQSMRGVL